MDKVKSPEYNPGVIEEVDLDYALGRLVSRWKLLLICSIICAVTAFAVSRVLPNYYESKATIYVQESSIATSLMRDLPINIAQNSNSLSGYIVTVLQSDTMLRDIIYNMQLTNDPAYAKNGHASLDEVLLILQKTIYVTQDKNGGISIIVRAKNPVLAANIANRMLDNLSVLVVTNSNSKVEFITKKLNETEKQLRKSEDDLLHFQQRNDIASVDEETKGMIDKLSELDSQLVATNMELQQVQSELANEGDVSTLVDLAVRKKSLQSTKSYLNQELSSLQGKIKNYPSFAMKYLRLQRQIGVLSKTYELLTEQLQLANISQHGENGDYQVVDRARPISKPVLPKPALNTAIGALLGFVIPAGAIVVFGKSGRSRKVKY